MSKYSSMLLLFLLTVNVSELPLVERCSRTGCGIPVSGLPNTPPMSLSREEENLDFGGVYSALALAAPA